MRMILTIALLMTSTLIFGATSNNNNQTENNNTINYMETLALEANMPILIVEERNSVEVALEGEETATGTKEIKKTTDKQANQAPKQDYEILKRSQRILEVKYKLYA